MEQQPETITTGDEDSGSLKSKTISQPEIIINEEKVQISEENKELLEIQLENETQKKMEEMERTFDDPLEPNDFQISDPMEFLNEKVLPTLIPALENLLYNIKSKEEEGKADSVDPIGWLAQYLYRHNKNRDPAS
jgi:ABC-type uncharacterized transport system involved in gliding motility auxiliary subunit